MKHVVVTIELPGTNEPSAIGNVHDYNFVGFFFHITLFSPPKQIGLIIKFKANNETIENLIKSGNLRVLK